MTSKVSAFPPSRIQAAARAIASANGDDFDAIPKDKGEWIDARGMFGGRFRNINEPMQVDYMAMAEAGLPAAYPDLASGEAWVAPTQATEAMLEGMSDLDADVASGYYAAMRDAHLSLDLNDKDQP